MRPKMPILVYCADRELLSATAFALRLQPYDVTAIDDSRSAAAVMMASHLMCGILIHARQGDLAPVRYADMVLYGRNTSMAHILGALNVLCARKRGPRSAA